MDQIGNLSRSGILHICVDVTIGESYFNPGDRKTSLLFAYLENSCFIHDLYVSIFGDLNQKYEDLLCAQIIRPKVFALGIYTYYLNRHKKGKSMFVLDRKTGKWSGVENGIGFHMQCNHLEEILFDSKSNPVEIQIEFSTLDHLREDAFFNVITYAHISYESKRTLFNQ